MEAISRGFYTSNCGADWAMYILPQYQYSCLQIYRYTSWFRVLYAIKNLPILKICKLSLWIFKILLQAKFLQSPNFCLVYHGVYQFMKPTVPSQQLIHYLVSTANAKDRLLLVTPRPRWCHVQLLKLSPIVTKVLYCSCRPSSKEALIGLSFDYNSSIIITVCIKLLFSWL